MLSQTLKSKVESYFYRVKDTNPLFDNARKGKITEKEVGAYLVNILYLIQHTPIYLNYAVRKAEERGQEEIAWFFKTKMGEESGHDKWAEKDISALTKEFQYTPPSQICPEISSLVSYLKEVIDKDPALYIAYIFLAEYFTVLLGPQWLNDLETECGIPKSMMSVIGNHVELDKEHVLEDIREIDRLIQDADEKKYVEVLEKAISLHEHFCSRVGKVA